MMPPMSTDALVVYTLFMTAMAWFKKKQSNNDPTSVDDDREVVEAHEFILDTVNDDDQVWAIKTVTGKDIRDQLTANDANDMRKEADLRKMGARRN